MKKADSRNNYILIAGGVLLSAAIIFMLFGSSTTNLTTGSLVQTGNRYDAYYNYRGCSGDYANTYWYDFNGVYDTRSMGYMSIDCSDTNPRKTMETAVFYHTRATEFDTVYINGKLYQAPKYIHDLPTKTYITDVSPVGSTNINAITNTPINVPLTLKMFPQDTVAKDGNMTIGWYKITILDSFMNPIQDHTWVQFPEQYTATKTIDFGFTPTYETIYYISLVGVKQNYTFAGDKWTVTEAFDSRDLKQITSRVSFATPTPTPIQTVVITPVKTPVITPVITPIITSVTPIPTPTDKSPVSATGIGIIAVGLILIVVLGYIYKR